MQSSSSPVSSQLQQPCECTDERLNCSHTGGGEAPCECECGEEAKPCSHTAKTRSVRRTCTDCSCTQPCGHKPQSEGRIKRVKCRVRRAGCAMARCTAELAMLHLHWELAAECAPCRPRALTRRLCRRQQSDNELYRSNSFKFERFERTKDECVTPLRKQVSPLSSSLLIFIELFRLFFTIEYEVARRDDISEYIPNYLLYFRKSRIARHVLTREYSDILTYFISMFV